MTTNYEKIKNMTVEEMAEIFKKAFDDNIEQFGCGSCINYNTHHYPNDCEDCYWLPIGTSVKQWLESEAEE